MGFQISFISLLLIKKICFICSGAAFKRKKTSFSVWGTIEGPTGFKYLGNRHGLACRKLKK